MSETEEDDYMSTKFLEEAADYESKTRSEGTYSQRRQRTLQVQKQKGHIKPREQLQREAREEGLKRNLEEDKNNKGMQLLMKMGFKKGMKLGKSEGGLEKPLEVELKQGREGLGMAEARKRALEEEEEREAAKRPHIDPDEYRELMANKAKESKLHRRSTAAAAICERLDIENGIESNILWIFCPKDEEQQQHTGDGDLTEQEAKGYALTEQAGEDEDEEEEKEEEELPYPKEEVEELRSLPLDKRLTRLVDYLRDKHSYCFWCGAKYDNAQDLAENCPGPGEDDH
ncbi:hypothetical protein BDB00DRAFT_818143 [Zychaea mexicana]|uniref:uncharacterized protein n=1 Tax=Zychaea mexicana TaxID=64656 RepID=UPI0022FE59F8|nr:uncharacterized protein BDB00DRAFT_818143 [Zychaea mexicana]KAI9494462.1 hypothetical protein BDB00DRAFT_818143 [Zychaea mexicana]